MVHGNLTNHHWRFKDLTGKTFGRWTVIGYAGKSSLRMSLWNCRCECGMIGLVRSGHLKNGASKSCGCLISEVTTIRNTIHGGHNLREYASWQKLKYRCLNVDDNAYDRYGGRGITVCERWANSFENFFADMGPRPSDKHSIDRINNDGNYEPGNCRWATAREQNLNQRRNRRLTLKEETMTITEWAKRLGVSATAIRRRIDKKGWSVHKALTTPFASIRTSRKTP